eukprot:GILK01015361.1.p1 GENE.GILK01015361.1~~GILK01015361.1.p1  ORF type:complete len:1133 (+),score=179.70 GILK01015361.1:112-3399(+)
MPEAPQPEPTTLQAITVEWQDAGNVNTGPRPIPANAIVPNPSPSPVHDVSADISDAIRSRDTAFGENKPSSMKEATDAAFASAGTTFTAQGQELAGDRFTADGRALHVDVGTNVPQGGAVTPPTDVAAPERLDGKEREKDLENLPSPSNPGLTQTEAERLLQQNGPNEIVTKKKNPILHFMGFFWGPMQFVIWVAIGVTAGNQMWPDLVILLILQFLNGFVAWREEKNAGDAIEALKKGLAPKAIVKRDGAWRTIASRELVVGDIVKLTIGSIIPADVKLLDGESLEVDQAAITGESLPVTVYPATEVYQGSVVKRGEIQALVVKTGADTFLGKASSLVGSVKHTGNIQKVVMKITIFIISLAFTLCLAIFIYLLARAPRTTGHLQFVDVWAISMVFLVASVPVATPVVVTAALAVGAHNLSEHQVIISRLSAIEELAGMDILCSDKTGTLTKNELTLSDPFLLGNTTAEDLILMAALASKRETEGQDAIDLCISTTVQDHTVFDRYTELHFIPFDPVRKRTEATIQTSEGVFQVAKGAPQVILAMANNVDEIRAQVEGKVLEMAEKGYRTLGVAKKGSDEQWTMLGLLTLYDPPRDDTAHTIKRALELGIRVKMITGDQTAIAKETARALGMNTDIFNTDIWHDEKMSEEERSEVIESADGFAEVFPEQKYQIVETLQKRGHRVGMTGDGVNDAPALKKADCGIAVSGATDAARAAADMVLTLPGLSVIIDAILRARMIFQRIKNYLIYRIAASIQLCFFFFFGVIVFNPAAWYGGTDWRVFRLTNIAILIITILTDLTTIAIGYDHVKPSQKPDVWNLGRCITMSFVLGAVACISTILWTVVCLNLINATWILNSWFSIAAISYETALTAVWLVASLQVYLGVLSARTESWWFTRMPGLALLFTLAVSLCITTFFAAYWWLESIESSDIENADDVPWSIVGVGWLWAFVWFLIQDVVKVFAYRILQAHDRKKEEAAKKIADEQQLQERKSELNVRSRASILTRGSFIAANQGADTSRQIYRAASSLYSSTSPDLVRELSRQYPHRLQRHMSQQLGGLSPSPSIMARSSLSNIQYGAGTGAPRFAREPAQQISG